MHLPWFRSTRRGPLLSCLLLYLLFASGCVALETPTPSLLQSPPLPPTPTVLSGESIPFETIAHSRVGCSGNYPDSLVRIAVTVEQFMQLWTTLRSTIEDPMPSVDFARDAVIVVVEECSSDCRHNIEVKNIIRRQNEPITIYAERPMMTWDQGCEAATSISYHIVGVRQNAIPTAEAELNLIVYDVYR